MPHTTLTSLLTHRVRVYRLVVLLLHLLRIYHLRLSKVLRCLGVIENRARMTILLLQLLLQLVYHLVFSMILSHQIVKTVLKRHLFVPKSQISFFQQGKVVAFIYYKLFEYVIVFSSINPRWQLCVSLICFLIFWCILPEPSLLIALLSLLSFTSIKLTNNFRLLRSKRFFVKITLSPWIMLILFRVSSPQIIRIIQTRKHVHRLILINMRNKSMHKRTVTVIGYFNHLLWLEV